MRGVLSTFRGGGGLDIRRVISDSPVKNTWSHCSSNKALATEASPGIILREMVIIRTWREEAN